MAKFGLFNSDSITPIQEYVGDFMKQNNQYVSILNRNQNTSMADIQVVAIHLDKGQFVKLLN